jgi:hypothetical protein
VDCADRPELQPAQATKLCPRQNGYFAHENPEVNMYTVLFHGPKWIFMGVP